MINHATSIGHQDEDDPEEKAICSTAKSWPCKIFSVIAEIGSCFNWENSFWNLDKYDFKLRTWVAFNMTSKISIPFKFECIQSLPLCQPNRIYSVYFKFVISSYAFWSFFFPNGYMIQRLELLENHRLQGLQSQIPRPGHKSKEWESLKTKEKKLSTWISLKRQNQILFYIAFPHTKSILPEWSHGKRKKESSTETATEIWE